MGAVKLSTKVRVKDYRFHHWDYGCFIMLTSQENKEHTVHSPRTGTNGLIVCFHQSCQKLSNLFGQTGNELWKGLKRMSLREVCLCRALIQWQECRRC